MYIVIRFSVWCIGHVVRVKKKKFIRKPEVKLPLGRCINGREDNIKTYFKIRSVSKCGLHFLDEDRDKWGDVCEHTSSSSSSMALRPVFGPWPPQPSSSSESSVEVSRQIQVLQGGVSSPTTNPQPGVPGYPFLSGSSPLTCRHGSPVPVAVIPPA
jgi:hypothetical protein